MNLSERILAGVARELIGATGALTVDEQRVEYDAPTAGEVDAIRKAILIGEDPLGDAFCQIRTREIRRANGATYTPSPIIKAMINWAAAEPVAPVRIVDPGAGSGRFLVAAAARFPEARLIAVEIDPLACLLLRANAAVNGFSDRLVVHLKDYRRLRLARVKGPTLFIGNPPYVRHHGISEEWKHWFAANAREQGFKASKLAGLHIHFFLKTRELAADGDFGSFITAAEWLDVNYGSVLRDMLADGLGGAALQIIDPKAKPFADAMVSGAITSFRVGNRPQSLMVHMARDLNALEPLTEGIRLDWNLLDKAPRWSSFIRQENAPQPGMIELGELFRVHRGQVTGSNDTWIENAAMKGVASRFLKATVTRARDLITAGETLSPTAPLRRVLDLPTDLDELTSVELKSVERFLAWAKARDAHAGFVAKHRRAWWAVQLRDPAPILSTYMARSAPTFVYNLAGARHINIAHGLYPRGELSSKDIKVILAYLRNAVTIDGGRTYAGGLVKFEPKELERLRIPSLDRLYELTDSLDQHTTHQ